MWEIFWTALRRRQGGLYSSPSPSLQEGIRSVQRGSGTYHRSGPCGKLGHNPHPGLLLQLHTTCSWVKCARHPSHNPWCCWSLEVQKQTSQHCLDALIARTDPFTRDTHKKGNTANLWWWMDCRRVTGRPSDQGHSGKAYLNPDGWG